MASGDPSSLVERLVGLALGVLVAALALYGAVQLVTAVWVPLALILGTGLLVGLVIFAFRLRRDSW